MSNVDNNYLASALQAGQLYEIDSLNYVAGLYIEPVTDEKQCFVEYADEGLLIKPMLDRLTSALTDEFPQARRLLIRVPGAVGLPGPWAPQLTYVRYGGEAGSPDAAIVPARPGDRDLIIDWLMRAFADAGASFGAQTESPGNRRLAEEVMAADDRETLVYLVDGTAVGHATLLCDANDPVTGEDFAELLDILVEPAQDVRAITRELVTAAAVRAGKLGKPLVGNVVHSVAAAGHGDRVVASLLKSGWSVAYRYWQRGIGPDKD
jgi:hypothetical protein